MNALTSILAPLGMNTGAIQDTLVGTYTPLSFVTDLAPPETRCYWWNCRDRSESFRVGVEWLRRL